MQFKELESGLRQKFTDNRIVFWHDPEQRFTDSLNELDLDNVTLLDMRGVSVLATKNDSKSTSLSRNFYSISPVKFPPASRTGCWISASIAPNSTLIMRRSH
jgi:predicted double-glycine peptidase